MAQQIFDMVLDSLNENSKKTEKKALVSDFEETDKQNAYNTNYDRQQKIKNVVNSIKEEVNKPYSESKLKSGVDSLAETGKNLLSSAYTNVAQPVAKSVKNWWESTPASGIMDTFNNNVSTLWNTVGAVAQAKYLGKKKEIVDNDFAKNTDLSDIEKKNAEDPTYSSKLETDYEPLITELESKIDSLDTLGQIQTDALISKYKEYQEDQKKIYYSNLYQELVDSGASEYQLQDFKEAVNSQSDGIIMKTAQAIQSGVESFAGGIAKDKDLINKISYSLVGEEYDANNPDSIGNQLLEHSSELLTQAKTNTGTYGGLWIDAVGGQIPYLTALALSYATGGLTGSSLTMAEANKLALLYTDASVLGETAKERMDEGYSADVAIYNALGHAVVNHLTESIGGDSLVDIATDGLSRDLAKSTIAYGTLSALKQAGAEGVEEGMEAALEPIIDNITLNKGITVKQYLDSVLSTDTAYQMLVGSLGGLTSGSIASLTNTGNYRKSVEEIAEDIGRNIHSTKEANAVLNEKKNFDELASKYHNDERIMLIRAYSDACTLAYNNYMEANPSSKAFYKASDYDNVNVDLNKAEEIIDKMNRPDQVDGLSELNEVKNHFIQTGTEELARLQDELNNDSTKIDAAVYETLDEDQQKNVKTISKNADKLGLKVSFADIRDTNGNIINGLIVNDEIVVNPLSQKGAVSTTVHEWTHSLENTEVYKTLKDLVIKKVGGQEKFDQLAEQMIKDYSSVTQLSKEGAEAEVVASSVENLLGNEDFIKEVNKYDSNIAHRMYEDLKAMFDGQTLDEGIEYAFKKAFEESKTDQYNKVDDREAPWYKYRDNIIQDSESKSELSQDEDVSSGVKYSIPVTDEKLLDFLNNQEHITTYKTMQVIDGKLYPPMAGKVKDENGKYVLNNPNELGQWMQSVEDPDNAVYDEKKGKYYYNLNKGNGSSNVPAMYNPYEHSSNLVLNDQFTSAYNRPNLVTVECEIPVSEMDGAYKAEKANDATGIHNWKAGVVASALAKKTGNERMVYLTRYIKPVRIMPDSEVAQMYKETLGDNGISVPANVVPPNLRIELEKAGVPVVETNKTKFSLNTDTKGNTLTDNQAQFFNDSVIKDKEGNLKVVYRGGNDEINVFDRKKSRRSGLFGNGFYFTDNESMAKQYGNVTPYYLNIIGPIDSTSNVSSFTKEQKKAYIHEVASNEDYGLYNYGYDASEGSVFESLKNKNDYDFISDLNATSIGNMVEAVELFNKVNGTKYDGIVVPDQIVAFDSKQIKRTDNLNPTSDKDVRYSLNTDSDTVKSIEKQFKSDVFAKGRRINASEQITQAIEDINTFGNVQEDTRNALIDIAMEGQKTKVINGNYDLIKELRWQIGNNFNVLPKNNWDSKVEELHNMFGLWEDGNLPTSYEDAKEYIQNYMAGLGTMYEYKDESELGQASKADLEAYVNGMVDKFISHLESLSDIEPTTESIVKADHDGNEVYVKEALKKSTDEVNQELAEQASAGNLTPEGLKALEDFYLGNSDEVNQKLAEEQSEASNPSRDEEVKQEELSKATVENAKEKGGVLNDIKKNEPLRKKKNIWYKFIQKMENKGYGIDKLGNRRVSANYDLYLNHDNMANNLILNGSPIEDQKSLVEISKQIPESEKNDFDLYMYHKLNIDSAKIGKNVFFDWTSEQSEKICNEFEASHPNWESVANDYYDYCDYLLNKQVKSGILSQETADKWKEMYPHYVPIKRTMSVEENETLTADPKIKSANKGTLNERTGGTADIQPLDYAMTEKTKKIYSSTLFNDFCGSYIHEMGLKSEMLLNDQYDLSERVNTNEEYIHKADENIPAQFVWYADGQREFINVPTEIYEAFEDTQTPFNLPANIPFVSWASSMRRNIITGANPTFWITNGIKDFQDIAFNSKHPFEAYKHLGKAYKELLTNGTYAKMYKLYGGEYNTYSSEMGLDGKHSAFYNKTVGNLVWINNVVESAPRLAEFMASLHEGDSIAEAMYNAAEVTTNFKRGGDYAKWLNRNGFTFLNSSIQGFSKQIRNIKDAYDSKGTVGVISLMTKTAMLSGIPMVVINSLLHRDDDDYDELSDYVKENYYVLWKTDSGRYIRIPKGRIANAYQSILYSLYENGVELVSDDEATKKATKVLENTISALKNTWSQIGINDPLENNIFSPIRQVINNETWYGEPIVSSYMEQKAEEDQYNEKTDMFSIWLGSKLNYSPMKINYLIDQYSGGIGDVLLPMLTQKAETGIDDGTVGGTVASVLASPFVDKFSSDPVFSSQTVTDFFALDEELTKLANKENATTSQILSSKYINSIQYQMNQLYGQRREIYQNDSLTDSEKYAQARAVQSQIDDLAKLGLDTYDSIDVYENYGEVNGVGYFQTIGEDGSVEWNKVDTELAEEMSEMNMSTKQKSTYYQLKTDLKEADQETRYTSIINSDLSDEQKNYVYSKYYDSNLNKNIDSLDTDDATKLDLKYEVASAESLKDSNGNTIRNSKALAVADAYADAGVLDDVFDYIEENGLEATDFGLTKTVMGMSYNQVKSAYESAYGEVFGNGESVTLSSSGTSTSSSTSSSKKAKSIMKAYLNGLSSSSSVYSDVDSVLKDSTKVEDVEDKVEAILKRIA